MGSPHNVSIKRFLITNQNRVFRNIDNYIKKTLKLHIRSYILNIIKYISILMSIHIVPYGNVLQ